MKASIIIPTKNGGQRFASTIDAIYKNSLAGNFEVIVIDSGSTDNTIDVVKKYPVRFYEISANEFNHGKVRNEGARLSVGEILIFLSQDAIPVSSQWLSTLIKPLDSDYNIAGVYGRQLFDGGNLMENYFLSITYGEQPVVKSLKNVIEIPSLKDIFFSNVNSAIRKDVWQKIPFNERLNMSEDQEFAKQALLAGYKIAYAPLAAVYHSHNYGICSIFKRNYESGFSLRGMVKERAGSVFAETVYYLTSEMKYISKNGGILKVPYALLYEFSRYAGFISGSIAAYIQHKLKKESLQS